MHILCKNRLKIQKEVSRLLQLHGRCRSVFALFFKRKMKINHETLLFENFGCLCTFFNHRHRRHCKKKLPSDHVFDYSSIWVPGKNRSIFVRFSPFSPSFYAARQFGKMRKKDAWFWTQYLCFIYVNNQWKSSRSMTKNIPSSLISFDFSRIHFLRCFGSVSV